MADITVVSHTKEFMDAVVEKMPLILNTVGQIAEGYAKEDCPVDTGLLRNSLTYAISGEQPQITTYSADNPRPGQQSSGSYSGNVPAETEKDCYSVIVGSNVVYAPSQEYNETFNHTVGKNHFLRDALQDHKEEYKDNIEAILLTIPFVQN